MIVWDVLVEAEDFGEEVAYWLSDILNYSCRLVFMPQQARRLVAYPRRDGEVYLGRNLIHRGLGKISVGDSVVVI